MRVRGGTVPSTVTWYEISAGGIDKIEGQSEFQQSPRYAGINISAMGTNIITLGDGNIVNANYEVLHKELGNLRDKIRSSKDISDSKKLDAIADIETIRDQLAKQEPYKTVIDHLWFRVKDIANLGAGFAGTVLKIGSIIDELF